MTILKMHTNPNALTAADKKLLSDYINANLGDFLHYCETSYCTDEQIDRLMGFVEDHHDPFDDAMTDIDI